MPSRGRALAAVNTREGGRFAFPKALFAVHTPVQMSSLKFAADGTMPGEASAAASAPAQPPPPAPAAPAAAESIAATTDTAIVPGLALAGVSLHGLVAFFTRESLDRRRSFHAFTAAGDSHLHKFASCFASDEFQKQKTIGF